MKINLNELKDSLSKWQAIQNKINTNLIEVRNNSTHVLCLSISPSVNKRDTRPLLRVVIMSSWVTSIHSTYAHTYVGGSGSVSDLEPRDVYILVINLEQLNAIKTALNNKEKLDAAEILDEENSITLTIGETTVMWDKTVKDMVTNIVGMNLHDIISYYSHQQLKKLDTNMEHTATLFNPSKDIYPSVFDIVGCKDVVMSTYESKKYEKLEFKKIIYMFNSTVIGVILSALKVRKE